MAQERRIDGAAGSVHVPVMAEAVLRWLRIRQEGTYLDCTSGAGGHTARIAEAARRGRVIAIDRDASSVALARARLSALPNVSVLQRNYAELADVLRESGIASVDGVLLDAGVSSMQLDDPARGFSFQRQSALDMRMDCSQPLDAQAYLAHATERTLASVLKEFGDVRRPRRIAADIVRRRVAGRMASTTDLAETVAEALGGAREAVEETRRVFQAIRMAVNDELRWLEAGVRQAIEVLAPEGRIVAISFHSGEDRVVKNVFREESRVRRELHPDGRVRRTVAPRLRELTRGPERPSEAEIQANSRCRSARLRAAEKLAQDGDVS